ncbi:MAG: lamin tail domain-containing protein, partial [Chthoniobacteraceae bacterium]
MFPPTQKAPRLLSVLALCFVFALKAAAQIVINEINYKPADPTKNLEFIELYNSGPSAVNVGLWRIEDAVDCIFPANATIPAGGYFVIAANATVFQTQYGFAPGAIYTGSLNSSGERIRLRDSASVIVDEVNYGVGFPWPTSARGGGYSMELINASLDNDLGASWRSSTTLKGTPRVQNSVVAPNAPPAIRQVDHTPAQPAAEVVVTVTARVTDPDGVAAVNLEYQIVAPGSYIRRTDGAFNVGWTSLAMHDDGLSGDAIVGDGIFSVQIPASVQVHRRLIRYRITVADTLGATVRVPYADDEQPNFAYFVYSGVPAWSGAVLPGGGAPRGTVQTYPTSLLNSMQTWHLLAESTDVNNSQYVNTSNNVRFYGTLVYDGKVYDHIQYHNRGIGSTYVSGKNKWAFFFNRARDILVRDNWGKHYAESWNSMPLDACASPWAAVHRGMAGVEEAYSYRLFELAGMSSLRTHYMQFRVVSTLTEVGATQYDGDFWGLYMGLEPTEGNFLDERGLADGNIYSIEGSTADKKHQGSTQPLDTS